MSTTISKSRYIAGVQSLNRLYLEVHQPELAAQPDASAEAITGAPERARGASVSFDRTPYGSRLPEHLTNQPDRSLCVGLHGARAERSALSWLERACDEHSGHVVFLKVEAEWDPLRQDPRFAELVQCIGL
jgi:hypothetical protein